MLSRKDQKFIKSLKVKKYRSSEKCFLVEGAKNVQELLNSDFQTEIVIGTEEFFTEKVHMGAQRKEVVKSDLLGQLSTFKTNHDGLAVAKMKDFNRKPIDANDHLFALDGVGDPGNLGTIIRTLDWFGFTQIVCSQDCAEFYHPKVINSSMGSFTRINPYYCLLPKFIADSKLLAFGADMDGDSIHEISLDGPSIFVMGSESHGISKEVEKHLESRVSIPRYGKAESLNVAMAAGIIASHLRTSK